MDAYLDRKGLDNDKIEFHRFRHSFITYMFEAKANESITQYMVGYKGKDVTDEFYRKIPYSRMSEANDLYFEFMKPVFDAGK